MGYGWKCNHFSAVADGTQLMYSCILGLHIWHNCCFVLSSPTKCVHHVCAPTSRLCQRFCRLLVFLFPAAMGVLCTNAIIKRKTAISILPTVADAELEIAQNGFSSTTTFDNSTTHRIGARRLFQRFTRDLLHLTPKFCVRRLL
jgi:hypothetical protein